MPPETDFVRGSGSGRSGSCFHRATALEAFARANEHPTVNGLLMPMPSSQNAPVSLLNPHSSSSMAQAY